MRLFLILTVLLLPAMSTAEVIYCPDDGTRIFSFNKHVNSNTFRAQCNNTSFQAQPFEESPPSEPYFILIGANLFNTLTHPTYAVMPAINYSGDTVDATDQLFRTYLVDFNEEVFVFIVGTMLLSLAIGWGGALVINAIHKGIRAMR